MNQPLGVPTSRETLEKFEDKFDLVQQAWEAASNAACFRSKFPVGSSIFAENAFGQTRIFTGCNVENKFFPATICAERNAATTAIASGFTIFHTIAIACPKVPGGNSCGLCRQVLTQWGFQGEVINIMDEQFNVRCFGVDQLLPSASGRIEKFSDLGKTNQNLIRRLLKRKQYSYTPYSGQSSAAVCIAHNESGQSRNFYGLTEDNASYGGSTSAEVIAMAAARSNGFNRNVTLAVNCAGAIDEPNPIDGESLQKLREFGPNAKILLVNDEGDAIFTSLDELFPDAFGPDSL